MNLDSTKKNKKNYSVKIFLAVFLFVFLFVNFSGAIANKAQAATETKKTTDPKEIVVANTPDAQKVEASCSFVNHPINCTLIQLLPVMAKFVSISATLFAYSIDKDSTMKVIDAKEIYIIWQQVRDLLNVAFIFFLLFSAFCTVFQISKYSFKSVMLNIVLMALLVNFSYPIARFIIDISNAMAYTLVATLFTNGETKNIAANFSSTAGLAQAVAPQDGSGSTTQLVMAFIFLFILAITLLMMALLFIIRIIALSIIIMFSPLAFTGSIIPGLQEKASSWWKELFNYSFFAPIMLFMLYVAFELIKAQGATKIKISELAAANSSDGNWVASVCKFVTPIVILWIGMGVAKGMSIAGAGAITDFAQKAIKGAGKSVSGYNFAKKQWGDYKKERDARKEEARLKIGKGVGEKINNAQDRGLAFVGSTKAQKRLDKRRADKNKKDIEDDSKDIVDKGVPVDTLSSEMNTAFATTPPTGKKEKIKQAAQAQAYLKQESDDRKTYVLNQLKSATGPGAAGTNIHHILSSAYIPDTKLDPAANAARQASYNQQQSEALLAAEEVRTRSGTPGYNPESDMRTVHAFINRQMKSKLEAGAKAQ